MPSKYIAGIWAQKYRRLTGTARDEVNQVTNRLFQAKTKVLRKLDPKRDRALCDEWLRIRDQVMQQRERSGQSNAWYADLPFATEIASDIRQGWNMATRAVESLTRDMDSPWIDIALKERQRGVAVKAGKQAHPRIMMYSRMCPHLYGTANQKKYMASNGDEGFKWCSAFVNWCFNEVGIRGTNNARALSWLTWGKPIHKPQHGAVVVLKTKSWNHVAFVTEASGGFKMLGGNQKPEKGKGPQCVSYQRIIASQVVGYRVPA